MRARDLPSWLRDTLLRLLPHATRPGLRRVGQPGPDSPVLLTGNFTLTVRRLLDAMKGRDAWLLVANSRGINVWCAATGGHLTDHDIIAVLRASGINELVAHRRLVLPQLSATGVERRRLAEATGWEAVWGPARLEDLPAFLDRGARASKAQRWMRFPLWERVEMALLWAPGIALAAGLALGFVLGLRVGLVAAATTLVTVMGLFAALPWLPTVGARRLLTFGGFAVLGFALGAIALFALGLAGAASLGGLGLASVLSMGLLSIDLNGTTPWYPSSINSFGNRFDIALFEDRCAGAADCVEVCPREVLRMNGPKRKVEILRPDDCIRCGACIVQCPEDALFFRFPDGRIVEAETVRRTRVNMLGRRTVELRRQREEG